MKRVDRSRDPTGRINIYVPDPAIRRRVKLAAAERNLTVSQYCLRAITAQLAADLGERASPQDMGLSNAVAAARRFQATHFGRRIFATSSAALVREARRQRAQR